LIFFHENYRKTFSPEVFAENSSSFWIGIEILRLPINRKTLSSQFSLDLPLHLRYHSSSPNQASDSIQSIIPRPEIFIGQSERRWEEWYPAGIWIDYGGKTVIGSSLALSHDEIVQKIRNSHQQGNYQKSLLLLPTCECVQPFLQSSFAQSFLLFSLFTFSSCPENSLSSSFPAIDQNPHCFFQLPLQMPFPSKISSQIIILGTTFVIFSTTFFLSWILIQQKKRRKENVDSLRD
jgi:hypothetical protein